MRECVDRDADAGMVNKAGWFVVRIKRYGEGLARARLKELGVASYLPMIVEWPRPAVGREVQPMFPGYLFVRATLTRDFYQITWSPGVKGFVAFGGRAARVDDAIVCELRGREGPDGLIRCGGGMVEGGRVRISDGAFRGLTAVVEQRIPARERVVILVDLLRRQTRVEISERCIARL